MRNQWRQLKLYFLTQLYDRKFHRNKFKYISQCLLATGVILITLVTLKVVPNAVVIASIGSSAFIVFTMPGREIAQTKFLVGGYLVGIFVGTICYFLSHANALGQFEFFQLYYNEIFGALAVGGAMFLMVVFNVEHAPAASLALGLVVDEWSLKAIGITLLAVSLILFFRYVLRDRLIDLI
jgi:CBS-domain-containing membrane protein